MWLFWYVALLIAWLFEYRLIPYNCEFTCGCSVCFAVGKLVCRFVLIRFSFGSRVNRNREHYVNHVPIVLSMGLIWVKLNFELKRNNKSSNQRSTIYLEYIGTCCGSYCMWLFWHVALLVCGNFGSVALMILWLFESDTDRNSRSHGIHNY